MMMMKENERENERENEPRRAMVFRRSWLDAVKNLRRDIQGEVLTAIIEYGLDGVTTGSPKPITSALLEIVKTQMDDDGNAFAERRRRGAPVGNRNRTKQQAGENVENNSDSIPFNSETNQFNSIQFDSIPFNSDSIQFNSETIENNCFSEKEKPPTPPKRIINKHKTTSDEVVVVQSDETAERFVTQQPQQPEGGEKPSGGKFRKPTVDEIRAEIGRLGYTFDAEEFFAYYESNGWRVGRNPMKCWRSALVTWQKNEKIVNQNSNANGNANANGRGNFTTETERSRTGIGAAVSGVLAKYGGQ